MKLEKFITDKTLEKEGVWVSLEDGRVRIARINNPDMVAAYAAKMRQYRGGKAPAVEEERIMLECAAEHVLVGWENFTKDGKPFEYSVENAKEALQIPDFLEFVLERAKNFDLFRAEETKDAVDKIAKN